MIRINVTSVFVDDQAKALAFYTDVLGFEKAEDIDLGGPRWLTVTSPGDAKGTRPHLHFELKPGGGAAVKNVT